jgi:hypothetical protein
VRTKRPLTVLLCLAALVAGSVSALMLSGRTGGHSYQPLVVVNVTDHYAPGPEPDRATADAAVPKYATKTVPLISPMFGPPRSKPSAPGLGPQPAPAARWGSSSPADSPFRARGGNAADYPEWPQDALQAPQAHDRVVVIVVNPGKR